MKRIAVFLFVALFACVHSAKADDKADIETVITSLKNLNPGALTSRLSFGTKTMRYIFRFEEVRASAKHPDGSYKKSEVRALMIQAVGLDPSSNKHMVIIDFNGDGDVDHAVIDGDLSIEGAHPELKRFVRVVDGCHVTAKQCEPVGLEFAGFWQERYREAIAAYLSEP